MEFEARAWRWQLGVGDGGKRSGSGDFMDLCQRSR